MSFSYIYDDNELCMRGKESNSAAILPWQFYKELLQVLQILKCEFLTAHDLNFRADFSTITLESFNKAFDSEFHEWSKVARTDTAYYLLLHDCDSAPSSSIHMCEMEANMGIRSTLSVYARWMYKGEISIWPQDFSALKVLQDKGFAITYHCNAAGLYAEMELSLFDRAMVFDDYDKDVDFLRAQGLDIRWYSGHGGVPSCEGIYNFQYFYPARVRNKMPSTHSFYGLSANKHYTDGAFPAYDIRTFLKDSVFPGHRHNILIHPCYYHATDSTKARSYFDTHPFVKEYWELYENNNTELYWKDTRLNFLRKRLISRRIHADK